VAPLSVNMDGPAEVGQPGLGPLRIWPGGLCVSRSIGDIDVGRVVIAAPHIRQVLVPSWGCRVVICSDGVWDTLSTRSVLSAVQGRTCGSACHAVVQKCLRVKQGALLDDTTCCVVDCRPHNVATFKRYFPERSGLAGGSVVCFCHQLL
jgi:serine/threonine protein phosphatase PrpC